MIPIIGQTRARTKEQMFKRLAGLHVFNLKWGNHKFKAPEKAIVNGDLRFQEGSWIIYAAAMFLGNPRFGDKEPAIALYDEKGGKCLTFVELRHLLSMLQPSLTGETKKVVDNIFEAAMRDAGLNNTPNDRWSLMTSIDKFLDSIYEFDNPWHKGVKEQMHRATELKITVGDEEEVITETNM